MALHVLKTLSRYFQAMPGACDYGKTFELRPNDRNFQMNDTVLFVEGENIETPKATIYGRIDYVLTAEQAKADGIGGLQDGWCVFAWTLIGANP